MDGEVEMWVGVGEGGERLGEVGIRELELEAGAEGRWEEEGARLADE